MRKVDDVKFSVLRGAVGVVCVAASSLALSACGRGVAPTASETSFCHQANSFFATLGKLPTPTSLTELRHQLVHIETSTKNLIAGTPSSKEREALRSLESFWETLGRQRTLRDATVMVRSTSMTSTHSLARAMEQVALGDKKCFVVASSRNLVQLARSSALAVARDAIARGAQRGLAVGPDNVEAAVQDANGSGASYVLVRNITGVGSGGVIDLSISSAVVGRQHVCVAMPRVVGGSPTLLSYC